MPLTDKQLRNAKKAAKAYKKSDGGGLYMTVAPRGAKRWYLTYRYLGKQRALALGVYPAMTLTAARQARETAKEELARGIDPATAHIERTRAAQIAAEATFEAAALDWHETQKAAWSADYADTVMHRLATDVFPVIGHRPVASIESVEVLDMLRKVESQAVGDMAHRLQRCVSTIFRFAIATGRCKLDPSANLSRALKARPAEPRSRRPTPRFDLASFLRALGDDDGDQLTRLAIGLAALTCIETSELRAGRWDEVEGLDGPEPVWRIPADRLQSQRDQLVPLSRQAAYVFRELRKLTGNGRFIFPSPTAEGYIGETTCFNALCRMGFGARTTGPGFRAIASAVLSEHGFESELVDGQLTHLDGQASCVADNLAELLSHRQRLMQWWADHLDSLLVESDNIAPTRALAS